MVTGEALTGVATARKGETTGCGYNECEAMNDVMMYVETMVTREVNVPKKNRWSEEVESHAIPEFRLTRRGVTSPLWTKKAHHGVLDSKGGMVGMSTNSS